MTGNAPVHPRLTPKKRHSSDLDLIQIFIAKNGVAKPTTAQEQRYARKEERNRGLLSANNPSAYLFRPGSSAYNHRSSVMSAGLTLDHKPFPLEMLTGEYAEEPPKKPAPPPAPPPEPVRGYCAHCHKQLPRRSRTDAKYCTDACRKAAARKAAKFAEANKAFKTDLTIAGHNFASEYSYFASSMNHKMGQDGIAATFWCTPGGVLITEYLPGAATLAMSMNFLRQFGRWDRRFDVEPDRTLTEHTSRDPKVIEMLEAAVSENTKAACEPELLGISIIKKDEQRR